MVVTGTPDVIIVGGGIAGLMTALRVADADRRCLVMEQGKFGAGSTTGNHGAIHSGALYAELHPSAAQICREASVLFKAMFQRADMRQAASWYFAQRRRLNVFRPLLESQQIPYRDVSERDLATVLRGEVLDGLDCVAIDEAYLSSRMVVALLVQWCRDAGVALMPFTPATAIVIEKDQVVGVETGVGDTVRAGATVVCAGLGAHELLETCRSHVSSMLRSRLDVMVAYHAGTLARPILCLDYGGPTIAPMSHDTLLASRYGGSQPAISHQRRFPVFVDQLAEVRSQVQQYFCDDVYHDTGLRAYMCSKTEVADGRHDDWGVEPYPTVIDHGDLDGIDGLWTMFPGKMTAAFHATREVAQGVLGRPVDLAFSPRHDLDTLPSQSIMDLVAEEPWREV